MKMYVVLFFENSCAAVPASWVREKERMCWWPPKTINLSKAIAKCTPYEDHWIMHSFRKLWGPYETYTIAKQAEKNSVEWSTADENVISTTPKLVGKRVITKSRKVLSNESSDNESSGSDKRKKQKLKTLPSSGYINDTNKKKTSKQLDSNNESSDKDYSVDESVTTEECATDTDEDVEKNELFEKTCDENTSFKDRGPVKVRASLSKNKVSFNNLSRQNIKKIAKCSCCEHCRQEHQEHFLKLEKKINYLIQVARSGDENRNLLQNRQIEIDALPDFHLQSKNAVDAFESQLSSNAVCTQFKHFMVRIGGKTATKHVSNILSTIFSDALARDYSWTGRKKTFAFQGMKMAKTLIETVLKEHPNTNRSEIQNKVMVWFHHAGDRWKRKHAIRVGSTTVTSQKNDDESIYSVSHKSVRAVSP